MIVVLPVCDKDLSLAVRNLEWCISLDGRVEFDALIVHERGFDPTCLVDLATRYFTNVTLFVYDPWMGVKDWPQYPNYVWQSTARHIESTIKKPWFWWEADAIPLKAGWLSILNQAHEQGARTLSGAVVTHAGFVYISGVAIYPPDPSRYMINAMLTEAQPWDIVAGSRDGIVRRAHDITPLICHTAASPSTHFSSPEDISRTIPETAVLFHKCKDGSLLDVLQGKQTADSINLATVSHTLPSFTEQTEYPSGIFTFPTASNTCYFNPSIVERHGKLWLFTRRYRFDRAQITGGRLEGSGCDLAIWELRDNLTVRPTPIIPTMPNRYPHEQFEDPKAVIIDDRVHLGMSTWVHYKPWAIRQSFVRLTPDWRRMEVLWETPYGGNARQPERASSHEKNWNWFWHSSGDAPPSWHCVYLVNPHTTFRVGADGTVLQEWKNRPLDLTWQYGEPRGGTPPIRIGDEYWSFFHSSVVWQKPKRRYYMGAYTFSASPPFELLRMTAEPILAGSEDDFRTLGGPLVVFPNGAVLQNGEFLVVFGVNDENCGWIRIPAVEVESRLSKVGSKRSTFGRIVDALQSV